MGTPLSTRSGQAPPPERKPGEFRRHPETGAPQVTDPTRPRKRQGKKADLLAAAEVEGIEVPEKVTVPELHELLGPEPGLSWFGRPSSLGKQIENTTNLTKWCERAVALGVTLEPDLLDELRGLDEERLNLDDDDARPLLDAAAVKAKRVAKTGIAAERGTHTHAITEDVDLDGDWIGRAAAGELLGIPVPAQRALAEAWTQMLDRNDLEVLAVEATCVDDRWRQAGTLDRIARLGRDLRFVVHGGEIVTVPAGTVLVLDVKTGGLRTEAGAPMYWHGYAVQIASYAQSMRYDPDTGRRSDWEWPIDQRWALIAHLDVLGAIDGAAECRLVLVDLEAGRLAGDLCVKAREWEKRSDVFSLVTDSDDTLVVVEVAASSTSDEVEKGAMDDFDAPVSLPGSPDGAPTVVDEKASTTTEVSATSAVVTPLDERAAMIAADDNGHRGHCDRDALDELMVTVSTSPTKAIVNAWVAQATQAGVGWNPRSKATERRFQILRAAHNMSLLLEYRESEAGARQLLAAVMDSEQPEQTHTVGHWLGVLDVDEAIALADMAAAGLDPDTDLAASAA